METSKLTWLSESSLASLIALDHCISATYEVCLELPIDSKSIKNFCRGLSYRKRICIGDNEYPYMLGENRNDEVLKVGEKIICVVNMTLEMVLDQLDLTLKSKKCKIDDGGGWSYPGTRYFYKDYYTEM